MSCKDCDKAHDGSQGIAYYRIDNADVGLLGCRKHVKIMIEKLNSVK